jgi:glycosyltransferase involved in cell wall biosynthesis
VRVRFVMRNMYGRGGGVLQVVLSLAGELAQRHDVELVSVHRDRDDPVHAFPDGVRVRTLLDRRPGVRPSSGRDAPDPVRGWALRQPSRLLPEGVRYRRDSLYSDQLLQRYVGSVRGGVLVGMQPGISLAIARHARDSVGRVAQEHRPFTTRSQPLQTAMLRHYPRLDALLTLTERDAQNYRHALGGHPPVLAVPNGAPPAGHAPSHHRNDVVVAAGRLRRGKGFDRLVNAWAPVAGRHPEWELRIFGSGPRRAALQRQIDRLGLQRSVHLMGYSSDILSDLRHGSVFTLSSRAEGYPMALLEAMSLGLAVVSFDCPTGPREIITPGVDGLLVPDGDIDGLADALVKLIEVEDQRRAMGAAARETAGRRTWARIATQWEEVLAGRLTVTS